MAAVWDIFWCKVFFKEYIKHYRKMTDEQIVKDVRQSMDDLEDLVSDTDTFGSQMVRWAQERADEPFATAARENGKKGGRPRKKKETTADGDTREDSQDLHDGSNAAMTESATSATHYGVAPNREAGDVSATDSNPITLDSRIDKDGQPNRRTGAPVRGATSSTAPVRSYRPRKVPHPKGDYEVFDFASENGIPDWVASEFYQRFFVERDGTDTDGNNIDNWKGALINYGKSRKRETA